MNCGWRLSNCSSLKWKWLWSHILRKERIKVIKIFFVVDFVCLFVLHLIVFLETAWHRGFWEKMWKVMSSTFPQPKGLRIQRQWRPWKSHRLWQTHLANLRHLIPSSREENTLKEENLQNDRPLTFKEFYGLNSQKNPNLSIIAYIEAASGKQHSRIT